MNKFLRILCVPLLLVCTHTSHAQYANGTGSGLHQNQIFWLAWGGPALISTPPGFTATNIAAGTYIWDLEPGLVRVVGQLSNIQTPVLPVGGTVSLTPYVSGTYVGNGTSSLGDGLQLLYPGVNPIGIANKMTGGNPPSYKGGVIEFDITLKLQMLISGVWTDLNYPGMVIADAESMAADNQGTEYISATTNGTTGWQILDVRNNAASIGKDPTNYKLQIGSGGKYFKLYNNLVKNMGVQAVMYAQGTTTLTNVQMQGEGITALALGFIAPFDYGDAPESYGEAAHYIDNLSLNGTPLTADGTYSVTGQTIASLVVPTANVYINQLPDPDGGLNHFSPNADVDGATTVPNYDGSGTYSLTIPITNNTGKPSNLGAWIDWNQNGVFDASEAVLQTLPTSATFATFSWTGLTTNPNPSFNYIVRVRVTTDPLTSPNAGATDGEVEDYALRASVAISGNVFDDINGLVNGSVDGTGTNVSDGLYVNLLDNSGVVIASVPVASDGTYEFGGALSGNYSLQLSVNSGIQGSAAPAIALPTGWVSTGETVGVGTGNDGIINSAIAVTINPGQTLIDVNFGIEQPPAANDKNYTITTPIFNSSMVLNGNGSSPAALTAADPEEGPLSNSKTVTITSLAEMNGNELYYNGVIVTTGTIIDNYDPSLLSIKFSGLGSTSAIFDYAISDAAGNNGTSASYSISWNSPLPVTLTSFTAVKEGSISVLNWETTSEINSDYFQIQRSSDAKNWVEIGTVYATGEGRSLSTYSFHDNSPLQGSNLYRLKMIDKDGSFSYSRIRELNFANGIKVYVYPNPVSSTLYFGGFTSLSLKEIHIYNVRGQLIFKSTTISEPGIDVKHFLPGMYLLKTIFTDGTVSNQKFAVNH